MCENCKDVKTGKIFSTKDCLACCKYVKDLTETGGFDFSSARKPITEATALKQCNKKKEVI